MVYRVIGIMSGSSLDGLDLAFVELQENAGKWNYEIIKADCYEFPPHWSDKLRNAIKLPAQEYQLLHAGFGHYIGEQVKRFVDENDLHFKVALIASHGHTTFHLPSRRMTAQLGDGAAIAAETNLPVVSDLRSLDVALGGQGAPIVPIGEKLLLGHYSYFLNLGGIANISQNASNYQAFDICPANRVLNMIVTDLANAGDLPDAADLHNAGSLPNAKVVPNAGSKTNAGTRTNSGALPYDEGGRIAASGQVNHELLEELNSLAYYKLPSPKSLANDFGTDIVYPLIQKAALSKEDGLRTYVEHIALQVKHAIKMLTGHLPKDGYGQGENQTGQPDQSIQTDQPAAANQTSEVNQPNPGHRTNQVTEGNQAAQTEPGPRLLVTGGGAFNHFLVERINHHLSELNIELVIPEDNLVKYKEALIMALIGVLRWRQEYNTFASVTGAQKNSIGGALWNGQDA